MLKDLTGEWFNATVRGKLYQSGWGGPPWAFRELFLIQMARR
ncbi:hypothetical protein [Thalassotalea sp. PS06]